MSDTDDCQLLVDAMLPFAEDMLSKHGEFLPFGANMLLSGEIVSVAAHDGREHPPSKDVIQLLEQHLSAAAAQREIVATAILYDVRVTPPGSLVSDAVAIALDHRSGYSVNVYFPYTMGKHGPELREPFADEGEAGIF